MLTRSYDGGISAQGLIDQPEGLHAATRAPPPSAHHRHRCVDLGQPTLGEDAGESGSFAGMIDPNEVPAGRGAKQRRGVVLVAGHDRTDDLATPKRTTSHEPPHRAGVDEHPRRADVEDVPHGCGTWRAEGIGVESDDGVAIARGRGPDPGVGDGVDSALALGLADAADGAETEALV